MRQAYRSRVGLSFYGLRLLALCLLGCGLNACVPTTDNLSAPAPMPQAAQPLQPAAVNQPRAVMPVQPVQTQPVNGVRRVGLLLPLTGAQAALGQSLQRAAMLAVQELAPGNFELEVYDTNRGAEGAFQAARAAGAQLLIGPLFSQDVQAIRGQALAAGIPVLALSNDVTLAGSGVYVMGFWPGAQIARAIDYAAAHGVATMAALVPDDAYGQRVTATLQQSRQVRILPIRYAAGAAPAQVAAELVGLRGSYDGVLLAEGGPRAAEIVQALQAENGLMTRDNGQPVALFGPGLWDDADAAQQPALAGGIYAAPDPSGRLAFAARYRQAFGDSPPRLASLGYDATALAAVLAGRGWPYSPQYLGQAQGFDGIDGLFRLRADGLVERGLGVLQLQPAGSRLVDPAPRSFR